MASTVKSLAADVGDGVGSIASSVDSCSSYTVSHPDEAFLVTGVGNSANSRTAMHRDNLRMRAFREFMSDDLETAGKLRDTAIVLERDPGVGTFVPSFKPPKTDQFLPLPEVTIGSANYQFPLDGLERLWVPQEWAKAVTWYLFQHGFDDHAKILKDAYLTHYKEVDFIPIEVAEEEMLHWLLDAFDLDEIHFQLAQLRKEIGPLYWLRLPKHLVVPHPTAQIITTTDPDALRSIPDVVPFPSPATATKYYFSRESRVFIIQSETVTQFVPLWPNAENREGADNGRLTALHMEINDLGRYISTWSSEYDFCNGEADEPWMKGFKMQVGALDYLYYLRIGRLQDDKYFVNSQSVENEEYEGGMGEAGLVLTDSDEVEVLGETLEDLDMDGTKDEERNTDEF